MRIIQLASYAVPRPGSFIPMVTAAAAACERRGWGFDAVFPREAAQYPWYAELGATVRTRTIPSTGRRKIAASIRELVDERDEPTILHSHFTRFDIAAAFAADARTATFWHLHTRLGGGAAVYARNVAKFTLARRRVAGILCVAPEIRERARRRLAPDARLHDFPNAVDGAHFALASDAERAASRERLGLGRRDAVMLHFGWDWEIKGGDLFVSAARELERRGRSVVAVSVGADDRGAAAAQRAGLDGSFVSVASVEDPCELYAAADVFLSTSRAEGMPFAVLESVSSGTPVVASDISGHALIAAVAPACHLAARTPEAFADAIEAVLDTAPPAARERAVISRERLLARFGVEHWGERLARLYEAWAESR